MSQNKQKIEERIPLEQILDLIGRPPQEETPAVLEPMVPKAGEKRPSRATVLKVIEGLKGV
jgi:hypothetical protein